MQPIKTGDVVRRVVLLLLICVVVGAMAFGVSSIFPSHGHSPAQITPVRNVPQQPLPQQNVPLPGGV
jgi:hypothetical protein